MSGFSHLDSEGRPQMVDVGEKAVTQRIATASGVVLLKPCHRDAMASNPKGDPIAAAIIAGIQGAKKCSELIPLCHLLPLSSVDVNIELENWDSDEPRLRIHAIVGCEGKTGVEMEAYIAVSIAGLTLIDMLKGIDSDLVLSDIKLLEKSGGKALWVRN